MKSAGRGLLWKSHNPFPGDLQFERKGRVRQAAEDETLTRKTRSMELMVHMADFRPPSTPGRNGLIELAEEASWTAPEAQRGKCYGPDLSTLARLIENGAF
jgi:hypothetical protein